MALSVNQSRWPYWKRRWTAIHRKAQKLLGLTSDEALVLFSPTNQYYINGAMGVESAKHKIDALIEDRIEFGKGNQTW